MPTSKTSKGNKRSSSNAKSAKNKPVVVAVAMATPVVASAADYDDSNNSSYDNSMSHSMNPLLLIFIIVMTLIPIGLVVVWDKSLLSGPFVLDSTAKIRDNPEIRRLGMALMERRRIGAEHGSDQLNYNDPSRPLASLSFQFNYYMSNGNLEDPSSFRILNYIIHLFNAVLVGYFTDAIRRAVRLPSDLCPWVSLAAGALFLTSPLNHGVAIYCYARSDLMGALGVFVFTILALEELITNHNGIKALNRFMTIRKATGSSDDPIIGTAISSTSFCFDVTMLAALLFGLFSKQLALIAPAALGFVHLVLLELPSLRDIQAVSVVKRIIIGTVCVVYSHLPSLAVIGAYIVFRLYYFGGVGDLELIVASQHGIDLQCYWKTQPYAWLRYFYTLLIPTGLAIDHNILYQQFCPTDQAAVSCLVVFIVFLILTVRTFQVAISSENRILSPGQLELVVLACLGWYWLHLLPPSVTFTSDVYVERRAYVSGAGLYAALSIIVLESSRRRFAAAKWSFGLSIIAYLVARFVFLDLGRNPVFYSSESVWREVVSVYPDSVRGRNNLGNELIEKLKGEIKSCPPSFQCTYDEELVEEAKSLFNSLLEQYPTDAYALSGLASLHNSLGEKDKAIEIWKKVIQFGPGLAAGAHKAIGTTLHMQKKVEEAIIHYKEALAIQPLTLELHNNLALAYKETGQDKQAEEVWEEGIALFPDDQLLLNNKPIIDRPPFQIVDAIPPDVSLDDLVTIDPTGVVGTKCQSMSEAAAQNLKLGHAKKAEEGYQELLAVCPRHTVNAYNNLAIILVSTGRASEGREMWERGWELFPGNDLLTNNKPAIFDEIPPAVEPVDAAMVDTVTDNNMYQHLFDTALHNHKMGELQKAEEGYRELLAIHPRHTPDAYNNLALLLVNTGRALESREIWEKGWKLYPGNELLVKNKPVVFGRRL